MGAVQHGWNAEGPQLAVLFLDVNASQRLRPIAATFELLDSGEFLLVAAPDHTVDPSCVASLVLGLKGFANVLRLRSPIRI
jgi:hypothetical protein